MIPHLLQLLFTKAKIFPSDEIIKLVEKESKFAIPKFLDILIDLAFEPSCISDAIHIEARALLETIVNSEISFEMLRHLFELQGPNRDKQIKTIQGNTFIKALAPWKQNAFDTLIRRISSKPNGIRHLMLTLMDMIGGEKNTKVASDIAKCICRPPFDIDDKENHYKELSIQIIDLLKISKISKIMFISSTDKYEHSDYLKFSQCVAIECVHLCARINKHYAQKYLLDVIFSDFYRITNSELMIDDFDMNILSSEQLLETLNLHYSLLTSSAPSLYVQSVMRQFSPVYIPILFLSNDKNTKFTSLSKQIIVKLIELLHGSCGDTLNYLKSLVAFDIPDNYLLLNVKLEMRQCLDRENIEVSVNTMALSDDKPTWTPSEDLNNVFMTVLLDLSNSLRDDIVSKLFLWLLEGYFNAMENKDIDLFGKNDELKAVEKESKMHLLSLLCSEMETHCFTRTTDILNLAKIVLFRYGDNKVSEINNVHLNDRLNYSLSMIVCVLESGKLKDEDKIIFDEMFPILMSLRDTHPLEKTRDLATDISIIIATKGHVNFLTNLKINEDKVECISEQLKEAFNDINSDEVPFKAHGLLVIYKLLKAKDESAIKNRNKIYGILSQLLFHSESFVYLRAISGLSVIGSHYTAKMLPMIAQRIRSCRGKNSLLPGISEKSSLEDCLKLNEVFMKIINDLGETAPMYSDIILSTLLVGLSDEEEIIRASSLSNLAELCCQMDYIFASVIYEVVNNVCNVLVNDQSGLVKNAASLFIRRLLLGKNDEPRSDVMTRFPGDILLTIQRSLRQVLISETDDMVLDHVSVAYKSLDDSIKLIFSPAKNSLMKILEL